MDSLHPSPIDPFDRRRAGQLPGPVQNPAESQTTLGWRYSLVVAGASAAIFLFLLYVAWPIDNWRSMASVGIPFVISLVGLWNAWNSRRGNATRGMMILLTAVMLGGIALPFFIAGLGLFIGVVVFLACTMVSTLALPPRYTNSFILIGTVLSIVVYLIDINGPADRLTVPEFTQTIMPFLVGVLALGYLIFFISQFQRFTILTKLVIPYVFVVLASIAFLVYNNSTVIRRSLTDAANQRLLSAAQLTAVQLDAFFENAAQFMATQSRLPTFRDYLALPADQRSGSAFETEGMQLLRNMQQLGFENSYALMDVDGNVLLSSSTALSRVSSLPKHFNLDKLDANYILTVIQSGNTYITSPYYDDDNRPYFYIAAPVNAANGRRAGILIARYALRSIQTSVIALNNEKAGTQSFVVVYDENGLRLAHSRDPRSLDRLIVPLPEEQLAALQAKNRVPNLPAAEIAANLEALAAGLANASDEIFFTAQEIILGSTVNSAAVQSMRVNIGGARPWKVVFFQPQETYLAPATEQARNTTVLAVVVAAISALAASIFAQILTRPIGRLTSIAERVGEGDLEAKVPISSQDEIGVLSAVFNQMTGRLQETLQGLEARVEERTRDLALASSQSQVRASQLETISEVTRVIASVRDLTELLPLITQTISERFGYYHVGIFLVDPRREYAVLRAANSAGGRRMLTRGHRLRLGQGIVGNVILKGQPRIALDVGQDAVFFNNPDMPDTRSEIGLPLKVGENVFGALDVQSIEQAAFEEEDISLLGTLADQVSLAIENARLFSETSRTLSELQFMQRDFVRQQWEQVATDRLQAVFQYDHGQVNLVQDALVDSTVSTGTAPIDLSIESSVITASALEVPIALRGETIGFINLQELEGERTWSADELSLAKAVAEQVGLALENARLLEETQRRAEREALVAQISNRLRATNDPSSILQTAVTELRQALRARSANLVVPATAALSSVEAVRKSASSAIQDADESQKE